MQAWEAFYGPNMGYVLELYERYQRDPNSVDAETREYFDKVVEGGADALAGLARPATTTRQIPSNGARATTTRETVMSASNGTGESRSQSGIAVAERVAESKRLSKDLALRVVLAARLARSIREYGHLAARIDPLGAPGLGDPMLDPATHGITDADLEELPANIVWPSAGPEAGNCLDAIRRLRDIYSGSIGYEFDHVQNFDERAWLHQAVESGQFRAPLPASKRRALLQRLTEVETFERYLHGAFVGQRRFSIEGTDALVPMIDELIQCSAQVGTREVLIGMAHRGRLNVLAHVLGKPYAAILAEFQHVQPDELVSQGSAAITRGWTGDVKYHLGGRRTVNEGETATMQITIADNPSHLEFVDPVIEGFARAAQDHRQSRGVPSQNVDTALPVTIHGDAAFSGEGVVAETLNLSRLSGYQTGGTIRIIVNNQIGFTTDAMSGRSTLYASDLAKGFEIPIVHVNADDPDACLSVIAFAHAYRNRFRKDFLIDLVGYRRWGHNEGDEPGFTQPYLYGKIADHPTVRSQYAQALIATDIVTSEEAERMIADVRERLDRAREESAALLENSSEPDAALPVSHEIATAVPADVLRELLNGLLEFPAGFHPHAKLDRQMDRRRESLDKPNGIDWATAEMLAYASILADGTPIRLTGQDTERGTFSQRHAVLHDAETGATFVGLQTLPQAKASFAIYNSPLTESATIGFEYGYSVHAPEAMVLWEAQFGDFVNVGQVLIDQFLVAAAAKWRQQPALALLLPHGYEGAGPDHSSGRVERFLQLAAQDNMRIANCTTAAQYFHLLRLQAQTLDADRRPLVVMTPKSLLRHPMAGSNLVDLSEGVFHPVLDDASISDPDTVRRIILCSGKVAVDLATSQQRSGSPQWAAVVRVEQLYPFPEGELHRVIARYSNVQDVVWLQEEPRNMGAWTYMAPLLRRVLPGNRTLRYIGRSERASTAEGSADAHVRMQSRIVEAAFNAEIDPKIETLGVYDVG